MTQMLPRPGPRATHLRVLGWDVSFLYTIVMFAVGGRSNLQHDLAHPLGWGGRERCQTHSRTHPAAGAMTTGLSGRGHGLSAKVPKCPLGSQNVFKCPRPWAEHHSYPHPNCAPFHYKDALWPPNWAFTVYTRTQPFEAQ